MDDDAKCPDCGDEMVGDWHKGNADKQQHESVFCLRRQLAERDEAIEATATGDILVKALNSAGNAWRFDLPSAEHIASGQYSTAAAAAVAGLAAKENPCQSQ